MTGGSSATRLVVVMLAVAILFEAGAVSPALTFATEPSPSPSSEQSSPAPSAEPLSSPEASPEPAPSAEPSSGPSPSPEPSPEPAAQEPPGVERIDLRTANSAGAIVKLIIPTGQPSAGTYLVNWNGHGDALALWRIKSDATLELANSYTYSSWGAPTITGTYLNSANGNAQYGDLGFRFLYVGQFGVQWDNVFGLGLHYMQARHYSPALARFIQPDPSRLEANDYGYAGNSPITRVDPAGELWWLVVIAAAIVVRVAARVIIRAVGAFVASAVVQWIRNCQRTDWIRVGYTVIPNSRYGLSPPGGYTRVWAIRGGGTHARNPSCRLPFRYHIHIYNWNRPWMWLDR